jgi:hypothetical protein
MTQDGTRVIDSISTGNIDLEQYKKCDGTVEPRVEAFTARMTLGNSNIQYRPDFITLCPWYLQDLRNNGEFHISQNLVQQAIDFPGGDINDPDIDALTSLDTTMLHEVWIVSFTFLFLLTMQVYSYDSCWRDNR